MTQWGKSFVANGFYRQLNGKKSDLTRLYNRISGAHNAGH